MDDAALVESLRAGDPQSPVRARLPDQRDDDDSLARLQCRHAILLGRRVALLAPAVNGPDAVADRATLPPAQGRTAFNL